MGATVRAAGPWLLGGALLLGGAAVGRAGGRGPALRLPLEEMDFQPLPATVLNAGVAAMTLHYVDGTHLLLTFSRRRLMPRLADAQPGDFDRNVDALLLELPTGKVLARTSWRLRDADHYLWPLGDGEFLLRVRNRLTTIAPLKGLQHGEAFREHAFVDSARAIGAVMVSPSGDLLTLETLDHAPGERQPSPGTRAYAAAQASAAGDAAAGGAPAADPVQINFFRLAAKGDGDGVATERAGAVVARTMVLLPMDGSGLLTMTDQGRGHWAFDFHRHDGKVDELSPFDSSCRPTPLLVSRSEFIAFGCRGGQDRRSIGGFNLRGEEMWEQMFPESYTRPELSLPATGGRFALGRMVTGMPQPDSDIPLGAGEVSAEQVTVFQTESGRALLSLNLTPVLLAGSNFAMAPDGSALAVINNGAVEVYSLPEPNGKERKAMQVAELLVPERSTGPVRLDAVRSRTPEPAPEAASAVKEKPRARAADAVADAGAAAAAGTAAPVAAPAAMPAAATVAAAPAPEPSVVVNGDPQMGAETPRRRPTLYEPGEKGSGDPEGAGAAGGGAAGREKAPQ